MTTKKKVYKPGLSPKRLSRDEPVQQGLAHTGSNRAYSSVSNKMKNQEAKKTSRGTKRQVGGLMRWQGNIQEQEERAGAQSPARK
jgi:hypothetical protein